MIQRTSPVPSPKPAVDYAAVCQGLRSALDPVRAHAISLHDAHGDVLWLSEGSLGPDEHDAMRDAIEAFSRPNALPVISYDLGESRSAVMIRTIDSRCMMVGVAMIVIDSRAAARGAARLITPKLQRALMGFAATRLSPSPEPFRAPTSTAPALDRLQDAFRKNPIALHVQRLVPLGQGPALQRYEVLLRSQTENGTQAAPHSILKSAAENGLGSMIDRRVITELVSWLVRHPDAWLNDRAMFSVNLTRTALHDDHFVKFVELHLAKSMLPDGVIAFEIDAPAALTLTERVAGAAAALHRLGCPLVLDDFALRAECFALLRLPGVRYVKLAPQITANLRQDKIAQAAITGVVQMARVLGMHTVAKHTETAAEREWLTALGVDFVQSHFFSPPIAIESL